MIPSINVMMWGRKVGSLVEVGTGRNRKICFYFDPSYVRGGLDIAPLRAPLKGIAAQKGLPIYPDSERLFGGLPSFVADSLPDSWGHLVFSRWANEHNISLKHITALDRLAYTGCRGMGAMEFMPSISPEMETSFKVEIEQLSALAQTVLAQAKNLKAELSNGFVVESLFRVGTSAGGRRPKALINVNLATGECFSGQVATEQPGFTPMIIKFDERTGLPTTRIEYAYYLMARRAGLLMKPSRLLEVKDGVHFLTERFDRIGNEKRHVQTLAAMNPLSTSYEDLFNVARKLELQPDEMEQLFLQTALNFMAANVDDHNKNFSFLMNDDGTWCLAPAYDFTFTIESSAPSYVNRHSMTVNGKDYDVTKEDLLKLADAYDIRNGNAILDAAGTAVANFAEFADIAGISSEVVDEIKSHLSIF